ncbi:MAG: YwiC-like family protein [Candidatus Hydrogenedentes bacterium]|nr:YwiC-like family protein [Candidatus Hydrogenedentota bacterium]
MFRWRYAIPPEKGGWIWWIGPLVIGVTAAGELHPDFLAILLGAFSGFCIRQPLSVLVRAWAHRRQNTSARPYLIWSAIHSLIIAGAGGALLARGYIGTLSFALAALPVFIWDLWLLARGAGRHQAARDIAATAVLALTGPAAYWTCGGGDAPTALLTWLPPALQSAVSVVHMLLRLEQRRWRQLPPLAERLKYGALPLTMHMGALGTALLLFQGRAWFALAALAFALPAAEGLWAVLAPQTGATPKQLGMRQLFVSTASMALIACALTA